MILRIPGLPIRFELNPLMLAGVVLFALGVGGYGAGVLGAWPPDTLPEHLSLGLTLAGMALYFLGRIVQLVVFFKSRRNP